MRRFALVRRLRRLDAMHTVSPLTFAAPLVLLLTASAATAQTVPVHMPSDSATTVYEVFGEQQKMGREAPVARCTGDCAVDIEPGRYKLRMVDGDGPRLSTRAFAVASPSELRIERPTDDQRWGGLGLGIAGTVGVIGGMVAMTPVIMSSLCERSDCVTESERNQAAIGLAVFTIGAIVTPIGWTMFARSFRANVVVAPLASGGGGGFASVGSEF
jgi:hypothetical protein